MANLGKMKRLEEAGAPPSFEEASQNLRGRRSCQLAPQYLARWHRSMRRPEVGKGSLRPEPEKDPGARTYSSQQG